jgi:hypothetical protein
VAECRLPFSFNVVHEHSTTQRKRGKWQVEQERSPAPQDRVYYSEFTAQTYSPGNVWFHHLASNIDHQDAPVSGDPSPAPLEVIEPPHQVIVLPRTDGERDPILTQVNPESGSITGGAVIWLAGIDFPALFPLFARFGTSVMRAVSWSFTYEDLSNRVSQAFISPSLLTCNLPPTAIPGVVDITLSKHPQTNAPAYGTSIAKFQYIGDHDQL